MPLAEINLLCLYESYDWIKFVPQNPLAEINLLCLYQSFDNKITMVILFIQSTPE